MRALLLTLALACAPPAEVAAPDAPVHLAGPGWSVAVDARGGIAASAPLRSGYAPSLALEPGGAERASVVLQRGGERERWRLWGALADPADGRDARAIEHGQGEAGSETVLALGDVRATVAWRFEEGRLHGEVTLENAGDAALDALRFERAVAPAGEAAPVVLELRELDPLAPGARTSTSLWWDRAQGDAGAGAVRVELGPARPLDDPAWSDLGAGDAAAPRLTATGDPRADGVLRLGLAEGPAGSPLVVVAGDAAAPSAFRGAVLVPAHRAVWRGARLDERGAAELELPWPADLAALDSLLVQAFAFDPGPPARAVATRVLARP